MKEKIIARAVTLALSVYAAPGWAQDQPTGSEPLQTVTVTGFRSSLEKALNLKQQAIGIRDSIVAEDIGKFPEANVAESLQRIPGVYLYRDGSSNEGNRISIRGLGPQFGVTTINGAPVHTTSGGNAGSAARDFNYDVFASDLFGRVDFYKSPLAELDEGGIGGVVDMQTPRPFDRKGRTIRYSATGSYNDASRKTDPKLSLILSDTWGNWGALLGVAGSNSTNQRSGFQSTGGYLSPALGRNNAPPGYFLPFNFDLDYNDPRANLGNLTREQVDNALLPRQHRVYGSRNERERRGLVNSFQYKNGGLDISLDSLYSTLDDKRDEYTFGVAIRNSRTTNRAIEPGRPGHNGFVPIDVFIDRNNLLQGTFGNTSYLNEQIYYDSATDFGMNSLNLKYKASQDLSFHASAGRSSSKAYFTNNRIFSNLYGVTSTIDSSKNNVYPVLSSNVDYNDRSLYKDPQIGYNYSDEYDRARHLKFAADWNYGLWGGWSGKLKAGLSYVSAEKELVNYNATAAGQRQTLPIGGTLTSQGSALSAYMQQGSPIPHFASDAPGGFPTSWAHFDRAFMHDVLDPIGAKNATAPNPGTSFVTTEDVSSLFLQSDFTGRLWERELRINVGVRYARTDVEIDNFTQVTENGVRSWVPKHSEGRYSNVLPSLSAAYDLRDDLIVRASLGRTITRAGLAIIAGNTSIPNAFEANAVSGNPNLKPQLSDQVDLTAEWYFQRGSLLSGGLFHKRMKDLTQSVRTTVPFSSLGLPDTALGPNLWDPALGRPNPDLPINLSSFVNASEQKVSGLELAYQQAFSFLPAPWNGLGAMASYTRVKWPIPDWVAADGSRYEVWEVPRYSYSLTLYYERGPWALRTSYNYRDRHAQSRSEVGINQSLNSMSIWKPERGLLDASISYKISDNLEFRLDGMNLNNEKTFIYYKDMLGRYGDDRARTDDLIYDGRTIQLGLRGSF